MRESPHLAHFAPHLREVCAYGGLEPETIAGLEAPGQKLNGGSITLRRVSANDRPVAGTQLIREYQGTERVVTVLADGFEYDGRPYRSLSAIARTITGTRWNAGVSSG